MNSLLSGTLSAEALLQFKALPPLDESATDILLRTQSLDVTNFNETTVREEIISPLLATLGYDIQSYFSIEREKPIRLLGRKKFLDYNLTLWKRSFWLIEAKNPTKTGSQFSDKDISQAIGYSVHPEINAALVVLCDGKRISIFDREEDQRTPFLTVRIDKLYEEIDKVRAILNPWQIWFFEKRRIVRSLDKVFDKEFNMGRLDEFKTLVSHHLDSKRSIVVENMRSVFAGHDEVGKSTAFIQNSDAADLVEGSFFLNLSGLDTRTVAETLANQCRIADFAVIHRIFPDHARDMNAPFCMHALNLLIHLYCNNIPVRWLPSWLAERNDLKQAIQTFSRLCVTHFRSDPTRRNILLSAAGLRRLFKALMVADGNVWNFGRIRHLLERYTAPEDSWRQIVSSPERQNLLSLDDAVTYTLRQLVNESRDRFQRPQPGKLERQLREIWNAEAVILETVVNYKELVEELDIGEIHPTESIDIVYDYLGHCILCISENHPEWKNYILVNHSEEIQALAQMGSWQARKWLEEENIDDYSAPDDIALANRFFLGDEEMCRRLRAAYGHS